MTAGKKAGPFRSERPQAAVTCLPEDRAAAHRPP